jgi:thioredoxin-like negative regulator of GroEL
VEAAFELAHKLWNIPKLLDVEDVITQEPDDLSLVIYLAMLYHHCHPRINE